MDEKPVENSQNSQIPDETAAIAINGLESYLMKLFKKYWYRLLKVLSTYAKHITLSQIDVPDSKSSEKRARCCY